MSEVNYRFSFQEKSTEGPVAQLARQMLAESANGAERKVPEQPSSSNSPKDSWSSRYDEIYGKHAGTVVLGNLTLTYDKTPALVMPETLLMGPVSVYGLARGHQYGPVITGGLGIIYGSHDAGRLLKSESSLQITKHSLALTADTSMIAGGALGLVKFGPKWLAPALAIGGLTARLMTDSIPDGVNRR
ncbi:MAG: hypothetical protein K2W95_07525 [Candidatus Obscuribacterales bacterium]|nr:hypothetical protein [Candidatus Obscuribacterales bacterium]